MLLLIPLQPKLHQALGQIYTRTLGTPPTMLKSVCCLTSVGRRDNIAFSNFLTVPLLVLFVGQAE